MRRGHTIPLAALGLIALASTLLPMRAGAADVTLAPVESVPQEVRDAPADVQEAYRFAVANPDLLKLVPCYCGCEMFQHQDNYACYVEDVKADGRVVYSDHGLG